MIESRTVFDLFNLPYDTDAFDHCIAMLDSFQPTRPTNVSQDKFSTVADALKYQYWVSWFGSLNTSESGSLQANTQVLMPGYCVAKAFIQSTADDYDFIAKTQHQPKWLTDICGTVQPPILVGHQKGGNIEHDKLIVGNVPLWDGKTTPGATVQLGMFGHQYGFTLKPVAQAIADAVSRGVILMKTVADASQAGQQKAIAAYSLILEAWIAKWPDGYPTEWQVYDPAVKVPS